jgi:hypothetical protein
VALQDGDSDEGDIIMNKSPAQQAKPYWSNYYRATPKARLPGVVETIKSRSQYLYDLLLLCLRGAWELELRQFMPPASLGASVASLLELGLIERVDEPPRRMAIG